MRSGEEIQTALCKFVNRWRDYSGSEREEAQTYLNQLIACCGVDRKAVGAEFDDAHTRLYHIGIGRTHGRTRVLVLVQDLHIGIVDAVTGELLRSLILDPSRNYQRTGRPPGPATANPPGRNNPGP